MPYPPVSPEGKNAIYAGYLLQDLAGNRGKMTMIYQYLYEHYLILNQKGSPFVNKPIIKEEYAKNEDVLDFSQVSYSQVTQILEKISKVKMQHFDLLSRYILALGALPKCQIVTGGRLLIWNGGMINYMQDFSKMISYNIMLETFSMENYIMQAERILDKNLSAMLRRLAEDDKIHLTIFKAMKEHLKVS